MQSTFQLPLACISVLVSHMGSREPQELLVYMVTCSSAISLHMQLDMGYICLHALVWVYNSLSGIWEQNIGWFTNKKYHEEILLQSSKLITEHFI